MRISAFALGLLTLSLCLPACIGSKKKSPKEVAAQADKYSVAAAPADMTKLGLNFDNQATLLGYKLTSGKPKPGSKVSYTLYWRADKPIEKGWKLFTHVLNSKGKKILNVDAVGPLREYNKGGEQAAPPSAWTPGKIFADEQTFTIPKKYSGSTLKVITGIWKGNSRLSLVGGKSKGKGKSNRAQVMVLRLKGSGKKRSTRVPQLLVHRLTAEQKLKIDGRLDEDAWGSAASTGAFVNVGTGAVDDKSKVQGKARVLWDDEALYVGFEVQDSDIVGGFKSTDKDPPLWTKDTVELMVDPDGDGDGKDYYEIQVSPQNLVFDSQFDSYNKPKVEPNGPFGHQEWSAKAQSAVVVDGTLDKPGDTDKGYTVELRIPWASFSKAKQTPPKAGDTWRVNLYAMQDNGGVAWSPILGQGNFHKAARFGRMTFIADKPEPKSLRQAASEKVEAAKKAVTKDVKALSLKPKSGAVATTRPKIKLAPGASSAAGTAPTSAPKKVAPAEVSP